MLLRDLCRQPTQAAAITVTLFLGAALFAASYDAYRNLQASYDRVFAETNTADLPSSAAASTRSRPPPVDSAA